MISVLRVGFERRKDEGSPEKKKTGLLWVVLMRIFRVRDFIDLNLF